ncbi:MAG: S8 family serine peptidase, partial [Bacteriovoracaceae bacterium]
MEFHKRQSFTLIALVSLFYSSMGFSQSLAVLDTGIDDKHRDLISELLEVEDEVNGIDDDGNGFIDDSYGWNFRDDSRIQTPMKPLPSDYASLIKGMNIIQKRAAGLKVPRTDTLWLRQKTRRRKGAKFFFRLGLVSKFSHGSHVAGIAIKESKTNAEVISLQVLKGADLSPDKKEEDKIPNDYPIENNYTDEEIAKKFEEMVKPDRWQREIKLMRSRGVRVANCSFGLSEAGIVKWLKEFCYEEKIECSAKRKQKLAKLYMKHHRSYTDKALVHANPDILFVIAAGNSRSDNDISPTSPGQFEEDNQIRVAAWDQKNNQIAGFSNYGKTSVELAAPGVGIMSAAPGDKELMMSGTSMAAPYVSAAA